jgi:hypothetical protein
MSVFGPTIVSNEGETLDQIVDDGDGGGSKMEEEEQEAEQGGEFHEGEICNADAA